MTGKSNSCQKKTVGDVITDTYNIRDLTKISNNARLKTKNNGTHNWKTN